MWREGSLQSFSLSPPSFERDASSTLRDFFSFDHINWVMRREVGGLLRGAQERETKKKKFRKVGTLKDCSCNYPSLTPALHPYPSPNTHTMSLVSEGALDDFDKAKPSPAPPPTTTAPDASGPQKRSPGDTAKV